MATCGTRTGPAFKQLSSLSLGKVARSYDARSVSSSLWVTSKQHLHSAPLSAGPAISSNISSLRTDLLQHRQGAVLSAAFPNHVRAFSTTQTRQRDHHFDTLKFVQKLRDEGFSEEQAKAMMLVLSDVIEESIQNLTRTMVPKEGENSNLGQRLHSLDLLDKLTFSSSEADRSTYTQKVDFTKLRSELLAQDSNDTSVTLASHERLSNDLAKLNSRLRDEINRAQASVKLDLNLEKGRIREEAKSQELKIKETETRIEQEVASLKERTEGVKFSTLQWLM